MLNAVGEGRTVYSSINGSVYKASNKVVQTVAYQDKIYQIKEVTTEPSYNPLTLLHIFTLDYSGIARLEQACVQGFQKGPSSPHRVRLGPHSDGAACTARLAHPVATPLLN